MRGSHLPQMLSIALGLLILIGCRDGAPAATVTPIPPSATPAVVPTATSTPTITPTPAPSATPDVPLYDDGAWLLFQGWDPDTDEEDSHLWAVNWDGTGLTDLLPGFYVYQHRIQPAVNGSPGRYVAAITSYGWSDKLMFTLAHLPDGEVITNIPLTNPQTELCPSREDPNCKTYWDRVSSSMSISYLHSLDWSPDGTKIAFSGAQDGTQTDVYVYSLTDGSVSRLTWGQHPHHASNLLWSPDAKYIAYDDVSIEKTGLIYWADGIYVVRADGSMAWQIASEEEWPPISGWGNRPQKLGWTSDHAMAVYAFATIDLVNPYRLKLIDVNSGRSSTLIDERYCGAAFAPEQNVWLIETYYYESESYQEKAYLIQNGISNEVEHPACCWPIWSPELNAFITTQGLVRTDGQQTMLDLPRSSPLISPDGAYWAYPGLWIGETGKQPRQLSHVWLEVLQWSSNSRSALVSNPKQGLQYVAIAPDFELRLISQYGTWTHPGPWWDQLYSPGN